MNKFITEMIVNVVIYEHICHNIFLTFHPPTPLTNVYMKDENVNFSL